MPLHIVFNLSYIKEKILFFFISVVISCTTDEGIYQKNVTADLRLTEIKSWEIDSPELIPYPLYTGVLNDTSLIIVDYSLKTINHFDSEGNLINVFGGEGNGPGEFVTITHAAIHPDGRVAVADITNARFTIHDVYAESMTSGELDGGWKIRLRWVSDGLVISYSPFTQSGDILMMFYDPMTEEKEQFMHLELEMEDPPSDQFTCTFCDFWFRDDFTFYTSRNDTSYRITEVDPTTGDRSLLTRLRIPAVKLTESEQEEWRSEMSQFDEEVEPPEYKNRFAGLFSDHKDRVWALMNVAEGEPLHFDIFSPEGEYIGSKSVPNGVKSEDFFNGNRILFKYYIDSVDVWKSSYFIIDG